MNNTFIPESLNQTIGHWDINVGAILVIAQVAAPQAAGRIQDSPLQRHYLPVAILYGLI